MKKLLAVLALATFTFSCSSDDELYCGVVTGKGIDSDRDYFVELNYERFTVDAITYNDFKIDQNRCLE